MNLTKIQVAGVVALLLAVSAVAVWQRTQIQSLKATVQQLRAQTNQMSALDRELNRLRKIELDRAELDRARQLQERSQSELAKLRGLVSGEKRAAAEANQLRADLQRLQQEGGSNLLSGPMGEMMKSVMEQQFMGQMARLKEKLNLTPEQAQAIQEILKRQAELSSTAVQKVFSGKLGKDDMAKLGADGGNPKEQIKAVLTPEQQTAYEEYQAEESSNNARLAANAEMLQMQNALGLNQEQQDKVFSILYEQSLKQMKGEGNALSGKDPAALMQAGLDQKLQAMQGILTPTQLDSYRQQQETQLKFMRSFLGGVKSGTTPQSEAR